MEIRGDVLIRGLWESQTDAIIDVRFGDLDADTYKHKPMDKLLARWEKRKKDKHGKHCHEQQRYFSPFVLSVDEMLGKEALVVLASLSRIMAAKMDEPILHVRGWINGRIAIAVVRSYSCMIYGDRLPSSLRDWELDWNPGSGLGLA